MERVPTEAGVVPPFEDMNEMVIDRMNAEKSVTDYQFIKKEISSSGKLSVIMKKGGGFAIHLKKI